MEQNNFEKTDIMDENNMEEKYTYHDVLEILSGLSENELKGLSKYGIGDLKDIINNGCQNVISVYKQNMEICKSGISLFESLQFLAERKDERDARKVEEERQKEKQNTNLLSWYNFSNRPLR